jgi:hypothetical protein
MVEDGVVGPRYDMLDMYGRGPIFHQDGSLEYLAVRDGVLYRVKHVPTADN